MREKTIFTIYILIGLFGIGSILFLLLMPIDKNIYQYLILIFEGILIGFLLIHVGSKNYSYKNWFRIELITHQPLMIAIFTMGIFLINLNTNIVKSWFYGIIPGIWIILFVLSIFIFKVNTSYKSGFFKSFKEGETNKIKNKVIDLLNNEFKNNSIKYRSRNNILFPSNEEIIEIPKKSITIRFKGEMSFISGKKEKDLRKIIEKIDDYLYPI